MRHILTLISCDPLTSAFHRDYASSTTAHSVGWFESQEQRRTTAAKPFFFVRHIVATLYGRAVWEGETPAGSFARSLNPHGSAHPHESGEAENLNRLQRSFTLSKSQNTVRSGRRASDITLRPALRCRKGDLAILLQGHHVGYIVNVVEYCGATQMSDGQWLTQAWKISRPGHEPDTDYFKEDKYLLPIRPGDLDETEADGLGQKVGDVQGVQHG